MAKDKTNTYNFKNIIINYYYKIRKMNIFV